MDHPDEMKQPDRTIDGIQPVPSAANPPGLNPETRTLAKINTCWLNLQEVEGSTCFAIGELLNDLLGSPYEDPDDRGRMILKLIVKQIGIPRKTIKNYRVTDWEFGGREDK